MQVLASYFILLPIRDEAGVALGEIAWSSWHYGSCCCGWHMCTCCKKQIQLMSCTFLSRHWKAAISILPKLAGDPCCNTFGSWISAETWCAEASFLQHASITPTGIAGKWLIHWFAFFLIAWAALRSALHACNAMQGKSIATVVHCLRLLSYRSAAIILHRLSFVRRQSWMRWLRFKGCAIVPCKSAASYHAKADPRCQKRSESRVLCSMQSFL